MNDTGLQQFDNFVKQYEQNYENPIENDGVHCTLEDDDVQCGHIFYSETSRLLKYFCTFCRLTYDNINCYCEHLSQHIAEDASIEHDIDDIDVSNDYDETISNETDNNNIQNFDYESNVVEIDEREEQTDVSEYIENYSREYIPYTISDVDGHEEVVQTEVVQHQNDDDIDINEVVAYEEQDYIEQNAVAKEEIIQTNDGNYDSEKFTEYMNFNRTAITNRPTTNALQNSSNTTDFENLIDNTATREIVIPSKKATETATDINYSRKDLKYIRRSFQPKKKKRVTTVKIIAVKNRIAELYEKIKSEEEKRSKGIEIETNPYEDDTLLPTEALNKENHPYNKALYNASQQQQHHHQQNEQHQLHEHQPTQKVIGETVITTIPAPRTTTVIEQQHQQQQQQQQLSSTSIIENNNIINNGSFRGLTQSEKNCTCPACGRKFRNSFSLTIHKRSHYLESKNDIKLAHKCSDCNQLFNKISEMKTHLQEVHYPDGFICKICNRKLSSITLLESHMRKVHLSRPFNCNICKKNFDNRESYEIHIASHHVPTENFKCRICGRKYSNELCLNQHIRRHKEQVPQCCVVCGKMTLRITQHMKIHTPRPKRVLSCKECGKTFNFSSGLSQHNKVMHKQQRTEIKTDINHEKETTITTTDPETEIEPQAILPIDLRNQEYEHQHHKQLEHKQIEVNQSQHQQQQHQHHDVQQQQEDKQQQQQQQEEEQQHQQIQLQQYLQSKVETRMRLKRRIINAYNEAIEHVTSEPIPITTIEQCLVPSQTQNNINNTNMDENLTISEAEVTHKEEEAKRVIVELIQNATYTSYLPEHYVNNLDVGAPPIAREEIISAVNSIVNER